MKSSQSMTDVKTLRARARQQIDHGALTPGYKAKPEAVIQMLNEHSQRRSSVYFATNGTISWPRASARRASRPSSSSMPPRNSPMQT